MAKNDVWVPMEAIVEVVTRVDSKSTLAKKVEDPDNPESFTVGEVTSGYTSIADATRRLGLKYSQYTRRLLKERNLEGIKLMLGNVERWLISLESIEWRLAKLSDRLDARNYILRLDPVEEEKVRKFLATLKTPWSLEFAYEPKKGSTSGDAPLWAKVISEI